MSVLIHLGSQGRNRKTSLTENKQSLRTEDGRCGEENVVGGQRGEGGMTSRTLTTYRACRIGNIVIEHLLS